MHKQKTLSVRVCVCVKMILRGGVSMSFLCGTHNPSSLAYGVPRMLKQAEYHNLQITYTSSWQFASTRQGWSWVSMPVSLYSFKLEEKSKVRMLLWLKKVKRQRKLPLVIGREYITPTGTERRSFDITFSWSRILYHPLKKEQPTHERPWNTYTSSMNKLPHSCK